MTVPYAFGSATTSIPLSQLDANFDTPITLGNTAIQLGNTVTTLNNMTLANATVSSGNVTVTSASLSGNLTFTGTGNRIIGDFANGTISNRAMFQSNSANTGTNVFAIPNGTGTTAQFGAINNSNPTNASTIQLAALSTEASLRSGITGTGTYLPLTFYTDGSESMRIDTSGNVGIGTSSPQELLELSASNNGITAGTAPNNTLRFNDADISTASGQPIGRLEFYGNDTGNENVVAYIDARAGGSSGGGFFVFGTSASAGGAATDAFTMSVTGGIEISRTAVTSPVANDGNVFSGTYTPTLTNSTNVAASTSVECFYMRVGNVVTVTGQVSIDVTTTLTDSVLLMTLPIASTFTVARNCGGTGASSTAGTYGTETIAISANVANGAAEFRLRPTSTANLDYRFSFSYRVL